MTSAQRRTPNTRAATFGALVLAMHVLVLEPSRAEAQPGLHDVDHDVDHAPEQKSTLADSERQSAQSVTLPVLLSATQVAYPDGARGDAVVVLELVVAADGSVTDARVVRGATPFVQAALRGVRDLRFEPARRDGNPVPARIRFQVEFRQEIVPNELEVDEPPDITESTREVGVGAVSPVVNESAPPVEVQVRGERQSGSRRVSRAEAKQIPGAFGNPFRAIEMFPGVTPTLSGAPYFYVRGAPPGNLGYFLDDIRLPALFHVLAGPSVVHPALIESVEFYAGPYPARYGRFSGGIAAGQLRPPSQKLHGELNVRAFDSSALIEGPLTDATAVTLAGRYSYANPIAHLFAPEISVRFWDYQARVSHKLAVHDRLELFGFASHDKLEEERDDGVRPIFDAEFQRVAVTYYHDSASGTARVRSLVGRDRSTQEDGRVVLESWLTELRADFSHAANRDLMMTFGIDGGNERHRATIGEIDEPQDKTEYETTYPPRIDSVAGAYASFEWQATPRVHVTPGVRADVYRSPPERWAVGVSPRVLAEFELSEHLTALHGVGIADQPPSDPFPQPGRTPALGEGLQRAIQSHAGLRYRLPDVLTLQLVAFQSAMFNLTDGPGISRLDNGDENVDERSRSTGSARGLEFIAQRSFARQLSGYLAYTLAFSHRSVGRAEGPALFDRRHVLSSALAYRAGYGYRLGLRGSFYTGIPADVAYVEAAKDPPRTSPFYRIDVRAEKRWRLGDAGAYWAIVLEMLNATLHKEVLNKSCNAYVCEEDEVGPIAIPSAGVELVF